MDADDDWEALLPESAEHPRTASSDLRKRSLHDDPAPGPKWVRATHHRQRSWRRYVRILWWVPLLPVAALCWSSTLPMWPRRAAFAIAVVGSAVAIGGLTVGDALSSSQGPQRAPADMFALPTTQPAAPSTEPPDEEPPMVERLAALLAEPDPARTTYDRDAFLERSDLDHDCINTRHEVLQEEATSYEMDESGCFVASGEWHDPFSDRRFTDPLDLQVDHVVALGDAWRSGAWSWTDSERQEFSNDPRNLNAIYGPENQAKSDSGPAKYWPSNRSWTCAYAAQYSSVKITWQLTITAADFAAVKVLAIACDGWD
jgi:hypothetical protein